MTDTPQKMPEGFSLRQHIKDQGITTEVGIRAHMYQIQRLMSVNPNLRPHTYVVPKNAEALQKVIVRYIDQAKGL